jgi:NAD(P)-dependent dehydrogenase (short-subunit alcohol dehydrogenase family)
MDIAEAVALVTGGASGLGLATATALHGRGARVVLADLPGSDGERVVAGLGERAVFAPTDVTDPEQVQAAIDAAGSLGRLSVVVTCAGVVNAVRMVSRSGTPFSLEDFDRVVRINLIGTFNVIRLAAAAMAAEPGEGEERGVVVMTSSIAAFDGQVGQVAYAASKAGVAGMTLPIARDLAQYRIRVMSIAPGMFRTPMIASLSPELIAALEAQVPHPSRLGDPAEFAALVCHIVENPMLNGETIRLDGATRFPPR